MKGLRRDRRAKEPADSDASTGSSKAGAPTSLGRLALVAFIAVALVAAGAVAAVSYLAERQLRELERVQVELAPVQALAELEAAIASRVAALEAVAADPALARAVDGANEATLAERSAALAARFPDASRTRLVRPARSTPDPDATPPLSYACLALIREAQGTDAAPPVEVHSFGQPEAHIDMIRPVVTGDGGRVAAHLLVSYSIDVLDQALARPPGGGLVELRQRVNGDAITLVRRGDHGAAVGAPDRRLDVAGTRWQLAYWPGPAAAAAIGPAARPVLAVTVGLVVILGGVFIAWLRAVKRPLAADWRTAVGLAKDATGRKLGPDYPVQLAESQPGMEGLIEVARDLQMRAAERAAPASQPQAPAGGMEVQEVVPEGISQDEVAASTNPDAQAPAAAPSTGGARAEPAPSLPQAVFRAYDIRGRVGTELSGGFAQRLGQAVGSQARERGVATAVVGRDGRLSSGELAEALIQGLVETGVEVTDIGLVPTPVLYYAAHQRDAGAAVMVTGSHNPPDCNGFKLVLQGQTLYGDEIQALRERMAAGPFAEGRGRRHDAQVTEEYIGEVAAEVKPARALDVVVDCGNGVAGEVAPALLRALGCEVTPLYCEVDGHFPHHHPDPSRPDNLKDLVSAVGERGADLGLAFDGDGDRLGIVAADGRIVWPDRVLMLFAIDVLSRQPGADIVYDVKCSRELGRLIAEHGGRPVMWKTGHSLIKAKVNELDAPLGGELAGHLVFRDRWYGFDDALYGAARLVELLAADAREPTKVFDALPATLTTPELVVAMPEREPFEVVERLVERARFDGAELTTIDGLRADFADGWGLVRASNTTPSLVMRFEASDPEALRRIQDSFRKQIKAAAPGIELPF